MNIDARKEKAYCMLYAIEICEYALADDSEILTKLKIQPQVLKQCLQNNESYVPRNNENYPLIELGLLAYDICTSEPELFAFGDEEEFKDIVKDLLTDRILIQWLMEDGKCAKHITTELSETVWKEVICDSWEMIRYIPYHLITPDMAEYTIKKWGPYTGMIMDYIGYDSKNNISKNSEMTT